jgi:hypothetical protein
MVTATEGGLSITPTGRVGSYTGVLPAPARPARVQPHGAGAHLATPHMRPWLCTPTPGTIREFVPSLYCEHVGLPSILVR